MLGLIKKAGILAHIFIDFIFLERTLWPVVSMASGSFVKIYRHMSRLGGMYYLFCTIAGFLMLLYLMVR